jgi:hypothetical protein
MKLSPGQKKALLLAAKGPLYPGCGVRSATIGALVALGLLSVQHTEYTYPRFANFGRDRLKSRTRSDYTATLTDAGRAALTDL